MIVLSKYFTLHLLGLGDFRLHSPDAEMHLLEQNVLEKMRVVDLGEQS